MATKRKIHPCQQVKNCRVLTYPAGTVTNT